MGKPESIGELRDNIDIAQFDEWSDGILKLATNLRTSGSDEESEILQFDNSIYKVTVKKLDTLDD